MKKILTLLLLLTAYVSTASAADVTRRIVVENQMADWSEWNNDNLWIYIYTTAGETKLNGNWGDTKMTKQGSYTYDAKTRRVFYYDLTADESIFENKISIIVFNETGKGVQDSYNRIKWEGVYANDLIIYVYPDGDAKWSVQPLSYYLVNSSGANLSTLTYTQGTQVATGTYSHSSATTYAALAPNYALWDGFAGIRDWSLVYRPVTASGDYKINSFTNYSGSVSTSNANSGTFEISYDSNYDLSFDVDGTSFTFTPYFERTLPAAAVGYATFSSEYDVTPDPTLIYARYASGVNTTTGEITWQDFSSGIEAGQGALLKGTAGATYKFTPASTLSTPATNLLKPINSETKLLQHPDGSHTNFVLTKSEAKDHVAFYKVHENGSYVNAGTAYLQVGASLAPEFFSVDGDVAAIEAMEQDVKTDGQYFNLAGQRIAQPTKGLYIVNGKKVVIK